MAQVWLDGPMYNSTTPMQLASLAQLRETGKQPATHIDSTGMLIARFPHLTRANVASEYQITSGGTIFYVGRVSS